MNQGMQVNFQTMTQAEKTMLRYQYVMSNARLAMGDFAATANTWANVIKTLKQQFQALGGVIGGVFVNAFKPALIALRGFMQNVLDFAKTIADALGAIFGWTIEITASGSGAADAMEGLADSVDDAGSGAGDVGKGLGDGAKAAKAIEKNLSVLPFDELNQLAKANDSGGSGSGSGGSGGGGSGGSGGGGGMSGSGASAALVRTDSVLEKITSNIDTLGKLGRYISESLTNAMNSIPWDDIYEKARGFGTGLAVFLNSLITPDLFGALGKTIAGAINVAIEGIGGFADNFNWSNLGLSVGEGINKFFENLHWKRAGMNVNRIAKGILKAVEKVLDKVDWDKVGEDIGTFLENMDIGEIANALVKVIDKAVRAALKILEGMWRTAPLETTLFLTFNAIKILGLAGILKKALISHIGTALAPASVAAAVKAALFPNNTIAMSGALSVTGLSVMATDLAMGITNLTASINPTAIGMVGSAICDKLSEFITNNVGEKVTDAIGSGLLLITAIGFGAVVAGPIGALAGFIIGSLGVALTNPEMVDELKQTVLDLLGKAFNVAVVIPANFLSNFVSGVKAALYTALADFAEEHPNIAKFFNLDATELRVKATAEIEKVDQSKVGKPDIESTANFDESRNSLTAAQRSFSAAAIFGSSKNKLTAKQRSFAAAALFGSSKNNLTVKQRSFASAAIFGSSVNNLTGRNKPGIGVNALMTSAYNYLNYTPSINVYAKIVSATVSGSLAGATLYVPGRALGGLFKNGRWNPIESFASGGSPYGGQIFRARENGNPELVGTLKGSTAVMNNNQIVDSVANGVARSISNIRFEMSGFRPPEIDMNALGSMIEYAVASAMANNSQPVEIYTTIKTQNDEVLARAVQRGNRNINYRQTAVGVS